MTSSTVSSSYFFRRAGVSDVLRSDGPHEAVTALAHLGVRGRKGPSRDEFGGRRAEDGLDNAQPTDRVFEGVVGCRRTRMLGGADGEGTGFGHRE